VEATGKCRSRFPVTTIAIMYDGTDFTAIAAGTDHILALTSDGEILSWYWPNGDFPFDYFSGDVPDGIVFTDDIAAGYQFSLALKAP